MKEILKFAPLLLLYILLVLINHQEALFGDEIRYFSYAENLTKGFYTTADNPNLINGPGYPLYLALFVCLGLSPLIPKLVSAFLLFLGILIFYRALKFIASKKTATFCAFVLGIYWPLLIRLKWNNTEPISIFLLCIFIYTIIRITQSKGFQPFLIIYGGICIGYLALTRDIFSYVILVAMVVSIVFYVISRNKVAIRWMIVLGIGFLMVIPYLIYTHSLTGRHLYFSSNGGEQIYWMSSTLDGEFGSFMSIDSIYHRKNTRADAIHVAFIDSIFEMPYVDRNDALVTKAVENIKANPTGYGKNIIANVLRLVGHGPATGEYQVWATFKYLFTHFLLLAPFLLSLYPAWKFRKTVLLEIWFLAGFILIYLGGSSLVAAINRYFVLAIPFILVWLAYFYSNMIQISFKNKSTKVNTP